eukprot:740235-Rhodomonas_salina.1
MGGGGRGVFWRAKDFGFAHKVDAEKRDCAMTCDGGWTEEWAHVLRKRCRHNAQVRAACFMVACVGCAASLVAVLQALQGCMRVVAMLQQLEGSMRSGYAAQLMPFS